MSVCVKLFHGRKDPNEPLDDWGNDGPIFQVSGTYVHSTYGRDIKFEQRCGDVDHDCCLAIVDGLVYYDSVWYGDWSVYMDDIKITNIYTIWDEKKAKPPTVSDELHNIIGLIDSFILENGGDDDVPFEDFTCDEARTRIHDVIEAIDKHQVDGGTQIDLLMASKAINQQLIESPEAAAVADLTAARSRLAKVILDMPGGLYHVKLSNNLCNEVDSLMDLPSNWRTLGLPRKTWILIAHAALGKAMRVKTGEYGKEDVDEGFDPYSWYNDLRSISYRILKTFPPGDGRI